MDYYKILCFDFTEKKKKKKDQILSLKSFIQISGVSETSLYVAF